jgi:hypothetical protein
MNAEMKSKEYLPICMTGWNVTSAKAAFNDETKDMWP